MVEHQEVVQVNVEEEEEAEVVQQDQADEVGMGQEEGEDLVEGVGDLEVDHILEQEVEGLEEVGPLEAVQKAVQETLQGVEDDRHDLEVHPLVDVDSVQAKGVQEDLVDPEDLVEGGVVSVHLEKVAEALQVHQALGIYPHQDHHQESDPCLCHRVEMVAVNLFQEDQLYLHLTSVQTVHFSWTAFQTD